MGTIWMGPNFRRKEGVQIEYCDYCGTLVAAEDRIEATAEGLRGRFICTAHGDIGTNPSFNDLGGPGSAVIVTDTPEPHSGANWAISEPPLGRPQEDE